MLSKYNAFHPSGLTIGAQSPHRCLQQRSNHTLRISTSSQTEERNSPKGEIYLSHPAALLPFAQSLTFQHRSPTKPSPNPSLQTSSQPSTATPKPSSAPSSNEHAKSKSSTPVSRRRLQRHHRKCPSTRPISAARIQKMRLSRPRARWMPLASYHVRRRQLSLRRRRSKSSGT